MSNHKESNYPKELKYTENHEWVRRIGEAGTWQLGITWHAQDALGAVVYIELPQPGRVLKQGESCAVVESTKAVSEVYTPLAGTVLGTNEALVANPGAVNEGPYTAWLVEIQPSNAADVQGLFDAAQYLHFLENQT